MERFGHYQLQRKLTTGGMAEIFLAHDLRHSDMSQQVVVKRILPHLSANDEFLTMFLDEARIAARLNHPNIVQILELGVEDGSYFIAMEYIEGEDLRQLWRGSMQPGRSFSVQLTAKIVAEIAAGLHYAHTKSDPSGRSLRIVHRDISPQNILVAYDGRVKIVDFGIAKAADQATVTRMGVIKGKYSYMSPEQASGKHIDHRTDIFALGIVFHELLTGTRLFKRPKDAETLRAVAEHRIARPSEQNRLVPRSLDAIVMKALERDVGDRFQSAADFRNAILTWLLTQGSAPNEIFDYMALHSGRSSATPLVDSRPYRTGEIIDAGDPETASDRQSKTGRSSSDLRLTVDDQPDDTGGDAAHAMGSARSLPRPLPKSTEANDGTVLISSSDRSDATALISERQNKAAVDLEPDTAHSATQRLKPSPLRWLAPLIGFSIALGALSYGVFRTISTFEPPPKAVSPPTQEAPDKSLAPVQPRTVAPPPKVPAPAALRDRPAPPQSPEPPPPKSTGTVRFIVTPWADVTCRSHGTTSKRLHLDFGTTPFPTKEIPPGTYECVFENPDYAAHREQVTISTGKLTRVEVKLRR